ncbi:MAG: hypothetical protein ACQ9MH_26995 [Nitrospinales bacterium]
MNVHVSGRGYKNQTGIHDDSMTTGLKKLVDSVPRAGGKIAFQIAHCGRQTTKAMIGQTPMAPSSRGRDPIYYGKHSSALWKRTKQGNKGTDEWQVN